MIRVLIDLWLSSSSFAILAILTRRSWYRGRHHARDGMSTMEYGVPMVAAERLDEYIDVLAMPIHTCALPPVDAPAAYGELGPRRFMAAKESMRRRESALRAARIPTGALVALSAYGTPVVLDEWAEAELVGAAT